MSRRALSAGIRPTRHTPLALALAAAVGFAPLAAPAGTITVTAGGDAGISSTCTLRQAIASVNGGAAVDGCNATGSFGTSDTIIFDTATFPHGGANVITLQSGQLEVAASQLVIDASANGQVVIDANHASRVLKDSAASGGLLTLKSLTLRNGKAVSANCNNAQGGGGICTPHANIALVETTVTGNRADSSGGGIYSNDGDISLVNSIVKDNSASGSGGGIAALNAIISLVNSIVSSNSTGIGGGGISNSGIATLTNSTVSGNSAGGNGGGINLRGWLYLTNSTVSGNVSHGKGGGVYADSTMGVLSIVSSTISHNGADSYGGGINGGEITAVNSIVAGNTQTGSGDINPGITAASRDNFIGGDPHLAALADNGGATQTMLPLPGSPVIDASALGACPPTDQRGVPRPADGLCDIGAVEAAVVGSLAMVSGSSQTTTTWQGFFNPLTVRVLGPGNDSAAGVRVHAIVPVGAGQASAQCGDAISNNAGYAYVYCNANGAVGSYDVEVGAVHWAGVPAVQFHLTNVADNGIIFRDGFDPPGPRISVLANAGTAGLLLKPPAELGPDEPLLLCFVTEPDGRPLLRVDALRRDHHSLLRLTRFDATGQSLLPGDWQPANVRSLLEVQRNASGNIHASLQTQPIAEALP